MLIEFIVFIDEQDRLSSLEVVKYDGKELIEEIDPEMIVVSSEAC